MTVPIHPGAFSFLAELGKAGGEAVQSAQKERDRQLKEAQDRLNNLIDLRTKGFIQPEAFTTPKALEIYHTLGIMPTGGTPTVGEAKDATIRRFTAPEQSGFNIPVPSLGVLGPAAGVAPPVQIPASGPSTVTDAQRAAYGLPSRSGLGKEGLQASTIAAGGAPARALAGVSSEPVATSAESGAVADNTLKSTALFENEADTFVAGALAGQDPRKTGVEPMVAKAYQLYQSDVAAGKLAPLPPEVAERYFAKAVQKRIDYLNNQDIARERANNPLALHDPEMTQLNVQIDNANQELQRLEGRVVNKAKEFPGGPDYYRKMAATNPAMAASLRDYDSVVAQRDAAQANLRQLNSKFQNLSTNRYGHGSPVGDPVTEQRQAWDAAAASLREKVPNITGAKIVEMLPWTKAMSDPVASYLQKYAPTQQKPAGTAGDPVDEYLKRYGQGITAPVPADQPESPPEEPGILSSLGQAAVGAIKRAPGLAVDLIKANLEPFAGGVTQEQKDNPLSRSASKRFGPGTLDQTLTNEQRGVPNGEGPVEFAKSIITAPYTTGKAVLQSKTPAEVGSHYLDFAFSILAAHGLVSDARTMFKGEPPAGPPGSPREAGAPPPTPTATPVDQPLPEPPAAETIISDAEAARNAKKTAQSKQASVLAKRRIAWARMTPAQRAWVTPELPVLETEKSWGQLSDEHKAIVNKAWTKAEPASDTNLDTSGGEPPAAPPPTAGEAGGEPDGVPSGEAGAGAGAGQDPSVVGEIGASAEPDAPRSKHFVTVDELNAWRAKQGLPPFPQKSPVVGSIVPPVEGRPNLFRPGADGSISEDAQPRPELDAELMSDPAEPPLKARAGVWSDIPKDHPLYGRPIIGTVIEAPKDLTRSVVAHDASHGAIEITSLPKGTRGTVVSFKLNHAGEGWYNVQFNGVEGTHSMGQDQIGELAVGHTSYDLGSKTKIPGVQDLSRGTHGTETAADPGQALGPEELLKLARERGTLGNQTTSPGALETGLPPRTPEAEAVMRGEATSRDAERTQNLSSDDPIRSQLANGIELYRGVKPPGATPSDPGDFGSGRYFSSDPERAKAYGELTKEKITLNNPLILSSEEAYTQIADKFGTITGEPGNPAKGSGKFAPRKAAADAASKWLKEQGYDGVVVKRPNGDYEVLQLAGEGQTPLDAQLEALKRRVAKEGVPARKAHLDKIETGKELLSVLRNGKIVQGNEVLDVSPAEIKELANKRLEEVDQSIEGAQNEIDLIPENKRTIYNHKLRHFQAEIIRLNDAKKEYEQALIESQTKITSQAETTAKREATKARRDKEDAEFAEKMAKQQADHEARMQAMREGKPADGGQTPPPATTPTPAPPAPDPATLGVPAEPTPAPAQEPAPTPGAGTKGKVKVQKTVEELKAELAELKKKFDDGSVRGPEMRGPMISKMDKLEKRIASLEKKAEAAAKPKEAKPKKEPTPNQVLDRAESANDAALDKGQITQEQWDGEQNRIAEERLKLYKAKKAAATTVLADPAAPARVTQKAIPVDPNALDPRGFPGRMRDNLKNVPTPELEQRLTELVSRKGAVVGDKAATKIYQDRINQIHDVMAERGLPPEQRYSGGPNPLTQLRDFFKGRKVLRDKTPEQMSAAERKIAESVITEPELTEPLGLQATLRKSWQMVVDSQSGFKHAASDIFGKGSSDAKRLDMLSEVASGALTRAEEFIRGQGPMLPTADGHNWVLTGTKSIHDVIQHVGGNDHVGELGRVWASLNTVELYGKGKIAGPDVIAAKKFLTETDPKFIAGAIEMRKVAFDLAQYAHWSGLITSDALEAFAQQAFYAPIKRLLAHQGAGDVVGTSGGQDVIRASANPIRRLKGSRKAQLNPVETLIDNTYRTIRAAEQNYRVAELVKGAKNNPIEAKGILEPASHQDYKSMQKVLEGKADAAVADAAKRGIPLTKEQALVQLKMVGDDALNITDNLLHVWIDGKPTLWRMSDELSYAVKHMQAEEFKLFTTIAGLPAALVHAGVVGDPSFIARQLVLDSMQGYINSRYGFNPLKGDQIRGWLQLIRNTPIAKEYRLAGGGFSGYTSSRFRSANTSLADAVRPRTSGPLDEAVAQLKEIRPIQAWKTLVAPFEEAARVGEYMRARGAGASMLEAVYAAKRITTNFQRSGGEMMAAAHTVPFLNAAIQGIAQASENFSRAPKQWTQRAVIAAAVPAFTLWWMNKDDKEIQELRKTESGQRYFFFRAPGGAILKMRKPYLEGAIFANGIEAGLDAVNEKNPAALVEWGKAIAREAGFNPLTTLGYVPLSLWANKDLRTGLPIVPDRMDSVDPEYQAGPYTGSASRIIGEATGTSPAQVEFGIKNTLGGVGSLALKAVDAAIDYRKTGDIVKPVDIPGLNSFIAKYPTQSVKSMQDFYRESERLAKVTNTIKYLGDTRPEMIPGYLEQHKEDLILLNLYGGAREKIGASQRSINLIRDMPAESITQSEKEDLINNLILNMIQQAKITNEIAKQLR